MNSVGKKKSARLMMEDDGNFMQRKDFDPMC